MRESKWKLSLFSLDRSNQTTIMQKNQGSTIRFLVFSHEPSTKQASRSNQNNAKGQLVNIARPIGP